MSISDESNRYKQKIAEYFEKYHEDEIKEKATDENSYYSLSITINYQYLSQDFPEVEKHFQNKPIQTLSVAKDVYRSKLKSYGFHDFTNLYVYIDKYREVNELTQIRNLREKHEGELITITGVVREASQVFSHATQVGFECSNCGTVTAIPQSDNPGDFSRPNECPTCEKSSKKWFSIVKEKTKKVSFQKLKVEEKPETLPGSKQPQSIRLFVKGPVTGQVEPGDQITATGIVEEERVEGTIFDNYINVKGLKKEDKAFEDINIKEEEEEKFEEFAKKDDLFETIAFNVAPRIRGNEIVKQAIALQYFSGSFDDPGENRTRSTGRNVIHVLLVGDPGVGKSKIVQSSKALAPRGVYTSGKGTSSAGLTAAAVKNSDLTDTDEWTLEVGALVIADKGFAAIDEIDKMDEKDRSALHEALEEQQVSIAKAGINATLKSRCSVLAAANPEHGRFEKMETVREQIGLEPALFSRFDFVYTLQDEPDEENDREISNYVLSMEMEEDELIEDDNILDQLEERSIDSDFLRKYIAYARQNYNPTLTENSRDKITEKFVEWRQKGDGNVPMTIRESPSIKRAARASARMRLSETVEAVDVERAVKLKKEYLNDVGTDPETGEWDADTQETRTPTSQRERIMLEKEIIQALVEDAEDGKIEEESLTETLIEELNIEKQQVKKDIEKLETEEGFIYKPRYGVIST